MNSELYKLLMESRELDDDFINKAFEIIMKDEKALESFILDFQLDNGSNNYGEYHNDKREIVINKERILESNDIKNKKILALEVLRHEIEHARNLQRFHEFRDDIESRIVRYSLRDYAIEHGYEKINTFDEVDPFYISLRKRENYLINPGERLADIKAWKYIVNLLKNQRTSNDLLEARIGLYYAYLRGYKDNGWYLNPPTYEYLLKMGLYHEYYLFKKRVEEKQYVFESRLMYGLPLIEGEEYDKKILQKVRLQKRKK